MEPIREPRFPAQFEVRVWGVATDGKAFSQVARTVDIGKMGARIEGIECPLRTGDIIGVQYGPQKARFRVVWTRGAENAPAGEIGVEFLDIGRCLWPDRLPAPSANPSPSWPDEERRLHPRYPCDGVVYMNRPGETFKSAAKLTDLSLGGCYAETMSPLPVGTELELVLRVNQMEANARGIVRTAHLHMGNGIEFTYTSDEDFSRIERIVQIIRSTDGTNHLPPVSPQRHSGTRFSVETEALLAILEEKLGITRDDFLDAISRVCSTT
jgi:hypothetical protein